MFEFFKQKQKPQPDQEDRLPIPVPELPADMNNPVAIYDLLNNGDAIWGWYNVIDMKNGQMNYSAMLNMTYGFEGMALFRKEADYLIKYLTEVVGKDLEIYMKISKICKFTHSNVMELYNTELSDAKKLLYDEKQEFAVGCQSYVHDIDVDMIENALSKRRVMIVGDEHFFSKKDYPNGLPEDLEKE